MYEPLSVNDPERIAIENAALVQVFDLANQVPVYDRSPALLQMVCDDVRRILVPAAEGIMRRNMEVLLFSGQTMPLGKGCDSEGKQAFEDWIEINDIEEADPNQSFITAWLHACGEDDFVALDVSRDSNETIGTVRIERLRSSDYETRGMVDLSQAQGDSVFIASAASWLYLQKKRPRLTKDPKGRRRPGIKRPSLRCDEQFIFERYGEVGLFHHELWTSVGSLCAASKVDPSDLNLL